MKTKNSTVHLLLVLFFVLLAIPTLLWWRQSVLLVNILSLYALIATHWGAYEAARAKEKADANS